MDLKNRKLIYFKAVLLLLAGLLSAAIIFLERPTLKVALLLAVAVWSFCRAYYFAFYVVEHYVDGTYRFAGLWSFLRYLLSKRRAARDATTRKA